MDTPEVAVTIKQLSGTGTPPLWHCDVVAGLGNIPILRIDGYMPEVLAALRIAIDRLEKW